MKEWFDSLTDGEFALLVMLGIFFALAFAGYMYGRGQRDERERRKQADEERERKKERAFEQMGIDPTPHYFPKQKDTGNSEDNRT